jgi:Ca2+-binding RTX toxin-like protein
VPAAGTLSTDGVALGVSPQEIVAIAKASVAVDGSHGSWTKDGCAAFVWGVTNLAGLPFYDLSNETFANDPRRPGDPDQGYVVPHSWAPNTAGDGWDYYTDYTSIDRLATFLQPGDVVRIYKYGVPGEPSADDQGHAEAHSFIVVSNENGLVQVADNWFGDYLSIHSLADMASWTSNHGTSGNFDAVIVSRINQDWVSQNVPQTIRGDGLGDFSSIQAAAAGETWSGSEGSDAHTGTAANDVINGMGGDDFLSGGNGDDTFHAFSGAGMDVVTDFHASEGDRVQLDAGTTYTLSQQGADTIVDMGNGDELVLKNVTLSSLPNGWIFTI